MSDSNSNDGIPLLEHGNKQSESSSSDSQSSPGDDSSSSPSDSNSQQSPPSSDSGGSSDSPPSDSGGSSDSPPSDSGGSSDSGSSPDSGSSNSPPSSDSGSDSSQNSSPPPEGGGDSPPPPDSSNNSPPNDQSSSSKDSPPKSDNSSPSPSNSPKDSNGPPKWQDSPPTPRNGNDETPAVPSPPGSRSSQRHPELTPPSTRSESSSSSHSSRSNDSSTSGTIAGVTVAGVVIIALVALIFVVSRKKKRRVQAYPDHYGPPPNFSGNSDGFYYGHHSQQHTIGISGQSQEFYGAKPPPPPPAFSTYGSYRGPDSGVIGGGMSSFSYEELMGITNGFSRQNVIGEGGFGSVYKGFLSDGRAVAVKQLKAGSGQGEREFRAEVEIISRVHHRHLVSLVGYCIADSQRLLVYEFVSNKTLEYHLHAEGLPVMEWSKRMSIAVGAARGLAYLHEDCHPKIIHRDIKSANILVDDVFEAQVADFGLAKLSNDMSTHVSTRVMGTFGYMAPEYANSGKLTDRSDVFSFGVVLLELVTGRKPVDLDEDESLVEWARPICARAVETRDFSEIADPRLQRRYVESEMLRMIETAAACVRHSAQKRPRMVQVLRALDTDGDMPDISNGVKVGQSTIYQVGQYNSEMEKFRMMAFSSGESSEYQMYSGNQSKEVLPRPPMGSEFSNGDSETVAINPRTKGKF